MTERVFLSGSGQCAAMELGPLEGGYLELLNSNADPLQLYHLYDQMDPAREEIELCSGGLSSLWPLPSPSSPPQPAMDTVSRQGTFWLLSSGQHHGQLQPPGLAPGPSPPLLPSPPALSSASSKGLFPPEPDMDTINCEQFSRLLCDMEGDEETREAYANIGEETF